MKIRLKSLKVILSLIVACTIIVLTVVLIISSYAIAYKAVEDSFLNQLNNFNKDFSRQLANYYEEQINSCRYLASLKEIKEAVASGRFTGASEIMTVFHKETKLYRNILISSAEENTVILADSTEGKSVGTRWKGKGFDDNISETLKGNVYVSDPNRSPVDGTAVVLVTAPVMINGKIKAIIGLSCDVHTFSSNLVSKTVIGKTGYPFICTLKGPVFAHPKSAAIFKLDLSNETWGKPVVTSNRESDIIRYTWEGKPKVLAYFKNFKYRFITVVSIYVSDINEKVIGMAMIMILVGLAGIAAAGIVVYIIISRKLKPLEECKSVMNAMAGGKLDRRYTGRISGDEIGEIVFSMNNALDQFEKLIANVKGASRNLTAAVQEIATGNQNLSQRTSEQASALEEIASTIEETTQNINQNAENSIEANKLALRSTDMAVNGGTMVTEAVSSINEIYAFSKKISEIINVINEIAFQTNLLALNAAVEAARAGEMGRGFAVVAGEVRNLAQRSGNAAKEISTLIQESTDKIEHGTEQANLSGQSLTEIIESVKTVSRLISEMAAASDEQKQGINQINIAISELDSMTQQNAALVEETAASSEEMANQAQELESLMGMFTIRQ
jgi:methyl-accepting chemotaxis protein